MNEARRQDRLSISVNNTDLGRKINYRMTGWLVLLGYRLMRVLAAKLCRLLGYSRYHIEILSSLPATAQPHRWFFELITNIDIKCKINYDFPC